MHERAGSDPAKPSQRRAVAMDLVEAALEAADPERAVERHLELEGAVLRAGDRAYDLTAVERLLVVGAGKASGGMAAAAEHVLGDRIAEGWVNVQRGYAPEKPPQQVSIHPAGHPLPDDAGSVGTGHILNLLENLTERDLVLVLISGGASALLVQPVAGITLDDLQQLTDALLRSGASIEEVNAVRKHLSQVKGGRLAERIARNSARAIVLVLSDVVGSPLDAIGSGPCAPDSTTFAQARRVLERYQLLDQAPRSTLQRLERGREGQIEETPKPGAPLFQRVQHVIVGDNRAAARAAVERAQAQGLNALLLTTYLEGEAREAGRVVAALAKEEARYASPLPQPACLVLGGETTVTVRGDGKGGRNQELALAAALALDGWTDVLVATLATDGVDGPTPAAGAIVTGQTAARARARGLDPGDYLARNDSYALFNSLGNLITTGPTGTNVNDLAFVLSF